MGVIELRRAILLNDGLFLPPGYQQLEYIGLKSTVTRIDTGVPGNNKNLRFDMMLKGLVYAQYGYCTFGNYSSEQTRCWRLIRAGADNGRYIFSALSRYAGSSTSIQVPNASTIVGEKVRFECGYGWARITNDSGSEYSTQAETPTYSISETNIGIGNSYATPTSATSQTEVTDLYDFKIYDGTKLIRNYVPCKRKSDNKPGLYDTVNKTFNPSNNTAGVDFVAGPAI